MMFFLIMCTAGYKAATCQPPVAMPNQRACEFVVQKYREIDTEGIVSAKCVGVKK